MNSGADIQNKKILLICGNSQSVVNFRYGLIKACCDKKATVSVIALDDDYKTDIEGMGVTFYSVYSQNRSLNPFGMKKLQNKYFSIINKIKPDIVFTFMLKPNIFGVRAAKKAGVKKIFSMVEGLGDVFINNGMKWKIIRSVVCKLYRKSFKSSNKVFFLNNDDRDEFISRNLVKKEKCVIIPGIGVDLEFFAYKPVKNHHTFLMVARMLKTKGVLEYCQAARYVKQKYQDAVFNYLGAEGSVTVSDIQEYIDDGTVNYLGVTKDVRPFLEDCSVFVLPSYREGMPVSIMEAEAAGRAVIATNVVGCRYTVIDENNGFLIESRNFKALAEKMIWLLENKSVIEKMGFNSRKLAEEKFDSIKINEYIIGVISA